MLPELARRAIAHYSEPGDLVVDPMCGIGTTLVEAIHLGRRALGVELEPRWAALASANLAHARDQGATGRGGVIEGDSRQLPRLLAREGRELLNLAGHGGGSSSRRNTVRLPSGAVDLILTSPPYACEIGEVDKEAWGRGGNLCPSETRNYSEDRTNLGHARGKDYLAAMGAIYTACAAVLKPGGFLVVVTKNLRAGGRMHDLAGNTVDLCQASGLLYWQHVIALLAALHDGELVPRPSFWQLNATRKALARGERTHLVCHEDVLVFRKPDRARADALPRSRTPARRAAR